jgi:predicted SnoaL-like aldol condensation-catalyzing enzyme
MTKSTEERSVQIVLNAFDNLFNRRDYAAAKRFWSPNYIQHSAHIPPGRDGLFGLIKTLPDTLRYENHVAATSGDFVILHGRFTGLGLPAAWSAADIVRMEDGVLAEHWDVITAGFLLGSSAIVSMRPPTLRPGASSPSVSDL